MPHQPTLEPDRQTPGLTNLPLTDRGDRNAKQLGQRLKHVPFAKVYTIRCNGQALVTSL